jgi:hypothetical protein
LATPQQQDEARSPAIAWHACAVSTLPTNKNRGSSKLSAAGPRSIRVGFVAPTAGPSTLHASIEWERRRSINKGAYASFQVGRPFFSIKPLSTCGEARRTISSNVACQGPRRARADISVCACFLLFANLSRSLWNSAIEAGRRSCVVAADDTSCCAEQNIALSLGGDLFT